MKYKEYIEKNNIESDLVVESHDNCKNNDTHADIFNSYGAEYIINTIHNFSQQPGYLTYDRPVINPGS